MKKIVDKFEMKIRNAYELNWVKNTERDKMHTSKERDVNEWKINRNKEENGPRLVLDCRRTVRRIARRIVRRIVRRRIVRRIVRR